MLAASQIFIMQLLFGRSGAPIAHWWIITVYENSLPFAAFGSLRTAAITLSALLFLTTTTPQEGTLMLHAWHIPYRYAMLVTVAGRFFPLLKEEYNAIIQSQAVRGISTETVWEKIKVLPLTFLPFLFRTVGRTAKIALSMELRGFGYGKERTFTDELKLTSVHRLQILICVILPITYLFTLTCI